MRRKTLAQQNREMLEGRDAETRWYVIPNEPIERLFCDTETKEHVAVISAMLSAVGTVCEMLPTTMDDVTCVVCDPPVERMTLKESFMRSFVPILRRNNMHGRYTCDLKKWFEF